MQHKSQCETGVDDQSDWAYSSAAELYAIMELFEDSASEIDLKFSEARAKILEKLVSNPKRIIETLPHEIQAKAIIFEPKLAASFDWNRDELATTLFLSFQREPLEADEALAGLLRLASLSQSRGEVLYPSESASVLGIALVCKGLSLDRLEDAGEVLRVRQLVKEIDLQNTYKLIQKRADEMNWISSFLEEECSFEGSRAAKKLLESFSHGNGRFERSGDLINLSRDERQWIFAKLYERFCDSKLDEAQRVLALSTLHKAAKSIGQGLEEVYGQSLEFIATLDLSLPNLKERAAEIIEEDVFGMGQLLSLAAERLEDKDHSKKRRMLNFLAIAWDYYPTCREAIERYTASALALGHIDNKYLRVNDPNFAGERAEAFEDFCGAVKSYDLTSSSFIGVSPLIPNLKPSPFRFFERKSPLLKEVIQHFELRIDALLKQIKVLSEAAVKTRCLLDLKAVSKGGPGCDAVIRRLQNLELLPSITETDSKVYSETRIFEIFYPVVLSHMAERASSEGTGLRYKEIKRRILTIGRALFNDGSWDFYTLQFAFQSLYEPHYENALAVAQFALKGQDRSVESLGINKLNSKNRIKLLGTILRTLFFVSLNRNEENLLKSVTPLFTKDELGEAYLMLLSELESKESGKAKVAEILFGAFYFKKGPNIPSSANASRKIADEVVCAYTELQDIRDNVGSKDKEPYSNDLALEFVKSAGISEMESARIIAEWIKLGGISNSDVTEIANRSDRKVLTTLLLPVFDSIQTATATSPRGETVHYPTSDHKSFIERIVLEPNQGLSVAEAIISKSKLAGNIEIKTYAREVELRARRLRLIQASTPERP